MSYSRRSLAPRTRMIRAAEESMDLGKIALLMFGLNACYFLWLLATSGA